MDNSQPVADPIMQVIEDELARLRKSQAWLARRLNTPDRPCSPQTVNNWKRKRVPADWYKPIADAFGWTVDDLLSGGPSERGEAQPELTDLALEIALKLDAITERDAYLRMHARLLALLDGRALPESAPEPASRRAAKPRLRSRT